VAEGIGRGHDEVEAAAEDGLPHVGGDEARSRRRREPARRSPEHLERHVDADRGRWLEERRRDSPEAAAELRILPGRETAGESLPERDVGPRRRLFLVEGRIAR
jgi:hypothetical protein